MCTSQREIVSFHDRNKIGRAGDSGGEPHVCVSQRESVWLGGSQEERNEVRREEDGNY
jgi:hypothetical protein